MTKDMDLLLEEIELREVMDKLSETADLALGYFRRKLERSGHKEEAAHVEAHREELIKEWNLQKSRLSPEKIKEIASDLLGMVKVGLGFLTEEESAFAEELSRREQVVELVRKELHLRENKIGSVCNDVIASLEDWEKTMADRADPQMIKNFKALKEKLLPVAAGAILSNLKKGKEERASKKGRRERKK